MGESDFPVIENKRSKSDYNLAYYICFVNACLTTMDGDWKGKSCNKL